MAQKRVNCAINVWVRGPGLTLVFGWAYAAFRTGDHAVNGWVMAVLLCISYGNGQYYLERVCGNYHGRLALAGARQR